MQRIKVGLTPIKSMGTFKNSKTESLYSKLPKSVNLNNKYELQTEKAQKELDKFANEHGYTSGAEAHRTMKTYHNKFKAVQW